MNIKNKFNKANKEIKKINTNIDIAQLCIVDKMRYDNIRPLLNNTIEYKNKLPIQSLDYVRLRTLQLISEEIVAKNLCGSIAEAGVYKGFFASKMNFLFPDKTIYLFDTFEGFDEKDIEKESSQFLVNEKFVKTIGNFGKTTLDLVLSKMPNKNKCKIIKGKIPNTFKNINDSFCLVSIDLDFYEATYDALNFFYPRLVKNGYILLHDYNHDQLYGVKKALEDFAKLYDIKYVPIPDEGGTCIIIK